MTASSSAKGKSGSGSRRSPQTQAPTTCYRGSHRRRPLSVPTFVRFLPTLAIRRVFRWRWWRDARRPADRRRGRQQRLGSDPRRWTRLLVRLRLPLPWPARSIACRRPAPGRAARRAPRTLADRAVHQRAHGTGIRRPLQRFSAVRRARPGGGTLRREAPSPAAAFTRLGRGPAGCCAFATSLSSLIDAAAEASSRVSWQRRCRRRRRHPAHRTASSRREHHGRRLECLHLDPASPSRVSGEPRAPEKVDRRRYIADHLDTGPGSPSVFVSRPATTRRAAGASLRTSGHRSNTSRCMAAAVIGQPAVPIIPAVGGPSSGQAVVGRVEAERHELHPCVGSPAAKLACDAR